MATTQLMQKLGTSNSIYEHDVPAKVKRSMFDLRHKRDFTFDAGAIIPICLMETLPNDVFDISCKYLIKSFPLVVPPFTSFKVRVHYYYCRLSDLWRGALTFQTKGNDGSINLSVPVLNNRTSFIHPNFISGSDSSSVLYKSPQSLSSYFGIIPNGVNTVKATDNGYNQPYSQLVSTDNSEHIMSSIPHDLPYGGISLLPFMMYQKIYRYAYMIPNLLQSNKIWYPNDLTDGWRINYSKSNVNSLGYFCPETTPPTITNQNAPSPSPSVNDIAVDLLQLRYGLFEQDRFTTAIPDQLRGNSPVLDVSGQVSIALQQGVTINLASPSYTNPVTLPVSVSLGTVSPTGSVVVQSSSDVFVHGDGNQFTVYKPANVSPSSGNSYASLPISFSGPFQHDAIIEPATQYSSRLGTGNYPLRVSFPSRGPSGTGEGLDFNANLPAMSATLTGAKFTANQLRTLIALSVWQERNMRIQAGDYNQYIYAHFRYDPSVDLHEPKYIGGTADEVYFGEVIQTSESTTNSPLGKIAGSASVQASGKIGRFHCPDYGYIMGVMIVSPETVYTQGCDKLFTRIAQSDFYVPEQEGLGMEEILKREVFPTGTIVDNQLFGLQERNAEYKSLPNKSLGFFAFDTASASFAKDLAAYSAARVFMSQPNSISHQFCVMSPEHIRRDMLVSPSMPMFRASFANIVKAVRPLSYKNVPETFGF